VDTNTAGDLLALSVAVDTAAHAVADALRIRFRLAARLDLERVADLLEAAEARLGAVQARLARLVEDAGS